MNPQLEKMKARGRLYRWGAGTGDGGDSDGGYSYGGDGGDSDGDSDGRDGGYGSDGGLSDGFGGYGIGVGYKFGKIGDLDSDKIGFTVAPGFDIGNKNLIGIPGKVDYGISRGVAFGGFGLLATDPTERFVRSEDLSFGNEVAAVAIKSFVDFVAKNALISVNPIVGMAARFALSRAMKNLPTHGNDPSAPAAGTRFSGGNGGGQVFAQTPASSSPAAGSVAAALQRVATQQQPEVSTPKSMQNTLAEGLMRLANKPRQPRSQQWF